MDHVFDEALQTAIHFLDKSGEFHSFAVVLDNLSELRHIYLHDGDEFADAKPLIADLKDAARHLVQSDDFKTFAIVSNVTLTDTTDNFSYDAVQVDIDDKDCEPLTCYAKWQDQGQVEVGEIVSVAGHRFAFL